MTASLPAAAVVGPMRPYHMPGWKTMSSTKDARTREQREADRKLRQIEKLPRPEALHDFQYPYEKTVISDYMFQYPVYADELDTPSLFNITPPPDFFLYWNVTDFERTAYPPVPKEDHRLLIPSAHNHEWVEHQTKAAKYLRKHEVSPQMVPAVKGDVNLSVVFAGQYQTRAHLDEETGKLPPPPPPESRLTKRNYWFTAHCGNYIDLCELQQAPSVFFLEDEATAKPSEGGPNLYTLIIMSPDYPFRLPSYMTRNRPENGFFLNYMVANLPGSGGGSGSGGGGVASVEGRPANLAADASSTLVKRGDVVVPYVAPLPTEDAGTTRHVCLLYKQMFPVKVRPLSPEMEAEHFSLAERSCFRLHDLARGEGRGLPACLASLRATERALPPTPSAATFFQTKWDIQVQEYYEKVGLPEPAIPVDEEIEALLEFHAKRPEELRVRARHRPDGSTNMGNDPDFWGQTMATRVGDGQMQRNWSRRTRMGENGVPVVYPE